MLYIDATFEDTRIRLEYNQESRLWKGSITDGMTGEEKNVEFTAAEASAIIAFNLDPDGEPKGQDVKALYALLNPVMEKFGIEEGPLRPIP